MPRPDSTRHKSEYCYEVDAQASHPPLYSVRFFSNTKNRKMNTILVRQVQYVPLPAMLLTLVAALFVPRYSSLTQHVSELGIISHPAASVMPIAAMLAGTSVLLFGMGLWLHPSNAFRFSALAAIIFGISYFSAGVWPTGSAMHGLYGLTMFYVLVPACFAAELPTSHRTRLAVTISLAASLLSLVYMWGLLSGLEPRGLRGLTQRLAIVVIFGWYPFAAWLLLRKESQGSTSSSATSAP
jgi:hypothetical membrane protein